MSRRAVGLAAIVLFTLLSGVALGRGGGGHGGGGHGGGHFGHAHGFGHVHVAGARHGGRFAISRTFSSRGFRGVHSFALRGGPNFGQIRTNALSSLSRAGALRGGRLLGNPAARAQIAAAAALAGWHGGFAANGWWTHGNGAYGWVGPLFWPFAYYDIYDYTIWGDGIGFWDYGYPDIYAGIFGPYAYDDLIGYLPQRAPRRHARVPALARMCGDDSRGVAGLPIDQIAHAVQPNETQAAALDELGNASISAARIIREACPTQVVLTAPGRLAAMQGRIEAMNSAVATVRPALDKFYSLLDDEQKARFNALAQDQRKLAANDAGSQVQTCSAAPPAALQWPQAEIDERLHPDETQRAALQVLQDASSKAADMLKAACQPADAVTPPARLAAAANRLNAMLEAVKSVRAALENFYAKLTDEQKAQFESIGVRRGA